MTEQELLNEIKNLDISICNLNLLNNIRTTLPEHIVKESKNVLSLGVHRDVGWEQSMLEDNPNMNIHLYDPTPDTVKM